MTEKNVPVMNLCLFKQCKMLVSLLHYRTYSCYFKFLLPLSMSEFNSL
jgi:hypothetical protein